MMSGPCPVEAASRLKRAWGAADAAFHSAVILGSGLHHMASDALAAGAHAVPYSAIPGMPRTRVTGHAGQFVSGGRQLNGVILQQGRPHYYEGWSVDEMTFSVRVLAALGVRRLIVTNAAGGIRDDLQPGHLMIITDHLSFVDINQGLLAARLQQDAPGNPSFSGVSLRATTVRDGIDVWSHRMRHLAKITDTPLQLHEGCYAMMPGPNYETPAEIRMLRYLGADAVGMSTVPEALVARRLGMEVLGISCITNVAAGLSDSPLDHHEVGHTAAAIQEEFADWLQRVIGATTDTA